MASFSYTDGLGRVREGRVSPNPEIMRPDSDLINADWSKRTWDFQGDPREQAVSIAGRGTRQEQQRAVDDFMRLPAAAAMPDAVVHELAAMGLTVRRG